MRSKAGLVTLVMLAGCQPQPQESEARATGQSVPELCGAAAALHAKASSAAGDHSRPPACALPSDEWIAHSCAKFDRIQDRALGGLEEGLAEVANALPLPEYRVTRLSCRYVNEAKNEAVCSFDLALPGEPNGQRKVEMQFEYHFSEEVGPASRIYSANWRQLADCTPDSESIL